MSAGGNALQTIGLCLTSNTRLPFGQVLPFASAQAASTYFGPSSLEFDAATKYFNSYDNSLLKPGSLLFAQYNPEAIPGFMRSGNISALGLAAIQAMSGSLTILVDGYTHTAGSLNLSTATSYSAAAALIQTGLNASNPTEASVTGSIAPETASVTAAISGYILTVTAVLSGTLAPGAILTGTGVVSGTQIQQQLSGTTGGIGTYAVDASSSQNVASTTIGATYGLLNVTVVASGTLSIGQTLSGLGVTVGTLITGLGTGTGLLGTYYVSPSQTVSSEAITATATSCVVTYDSIANAFVITSGIVGPASSVSFATGTLSASLLMTSATGAVLSPGAAASTPNSLMNAVTQITQDWATFFLLFDPDYGNGNVVKLEFSAWTNTTLDGYAFICWDTDASPTTTVPALQSMGYLIGTNGNNYSGTTLIYAPDYSVAAMMSGYGASLNWNATNGRTTAAYRSQTGLAATVTTLQVAENLEANGYNYYGAVATRSQGFLFFYPGSVSGPFQWLDSYINQIYWNSEFELNLMELLTNISSLPYDTYGYSLVATSLQEPINEMGNFGAWRSGVTLSKTQVTVVNNAAGAIIAPILQTQGWYLQIQDANPQVREARGSPPCFFWYADGQSIQVIRLDSVNVQ